MATAKGKGATTAQQRMRALDTGQIVGIVRRPAIAALLSGAGAAVDVVGAWVWVEFDTMPSERIRRFLKSVGFRWSKKRRAWQHACGVWRRFNPAGDPRHTYGMAPVLSPVEESEVAA